MDLIKEYIKTLTNLNGLVPTEKVIEVYNSQNDKQITIDDISIYLKLDMSRDYVYYYKKHFINESIENAKEFKKLKRQKKGKPYYVPDKEQLLKYSKVNYYKKPEVYYGLYNYFLKNFYPGDEENVEMLCQNIVNHFELIGIKFKDEEELSKIMNSILNNNKKIH